MDIWIIVAAISQAISALIAAIAIYQTVQLHKKQILLEQRQFLMPLWEYIQQLNDIDPAHPIWVDVIKAVNILELIAISWEGRLIDEDVIRRMYSSLYIDFYQKIEECKFPPSGIEKNGKQMLLASPSVIELYNQLFAEHAKRSKLTSKGL
jgi:hypothetical protein